jgi:transcription-repair coupling factor (superfamily II helicase)
MHPLHDLARLVREHRAFAAMGDAAQADRGIAVGGAPGVLLPAFVALAAQATRGACVLVTPDIRSARRHARDLEALHESGVLSLEILVLPPLEGDPYALVKPHDNVQRERVQALEALATAPPPGTTRLLVIPARSLLLPLPPPGRAAAAALVLHVGMELAPHDAAEVLLEAGYVSTDVVSSWGEFSRRGAVLDAWPPDAESPVRAEYWGDEISEMRRFDPETQRSIGAITSARLGAVREAAPDVAVARRFAERVRQRMVYGLAPPQVDRMLEALDEQASFPGFEVLRWAVAEGASPLAHLPGALVCVDRPDIVDEELRAARTQFEQEWSEDLRPFLPGPPEVLRGEDTIAAELDAAHLRILDVAWADGAAEIHDLGGRQAPRHGGDLAGWLRALRRHVEAGGSAGVVLASRGRLDRMREMLRDAGLEDRLAWVQEEAAPPGQSPPARLPPGRIALGVGLIEAGAQLASLLVQAEADIFGDVPAAPRERRRKAAAFKPSDLRELKRGDLVVHVDHGIGRYDGVRAMGEGTSVRDFMVLVYQDDDKLYVPLDRLDLVERYSGVAGFSPKIDRLGGVSWEKVRRTIKKQVAEMAQELLELYAARRAAHGFRFSQDGEWQREFEASFPHVLTDDQERALDEMKADMQSDVPMDRLVVGDVGFGKTEVALRGAFKAVMDGKQVAILAPTTVLALQHEATLTRRFQGWPVRVEMLSRMRTDQQVAKALERLKSGECDVVVGTHRLLSKDVVFKDLGLLVVDEEQRFGVRHKERLKALRKEVDVVTLTATPIPRTLSMALGGLRDMSVIETPPIGRHAIQTYILPFSTDVIAAACRQELDRGGQVYVVHDRVQSLYSMADLVRKLVPGARVGVAHGQMPERSLEDAMVAFLRGDTDILVCTTVIENGLDIPRANTMIVNRADRHGLSQLYQLRGRVGRSDRQAHGYFFVPKKSQLSADARRRLAALQEFTDLGSGFRIAALDLEIRGAGNLLGGQQHGHIAAVGFDMYVRLLEDAVRELKNEPAESTFRAVISVPLDLRLPEEYVPDEAQRLSVYKRFATARDADAILALEQDVRDRHGQPPEALSRLAEHARLRVRAEKLRIAQLEADSRSVRLRFDKETKVHPHALMRTLQERPGAVFSPEGVLSVPLRGADWHELTWDLLRELG